MLWLQTKLSEQITNGLDAFRDVRDRMEEQVFFGFYGSPLVQTVLGVNEDSIARPALDLSPEQLAARRAQMSAYEAMLERGGFDDALTRAVLYAVGADRTLDQRCALALNVARKQLMHLSLAEFKVLVRDQFFVLQLEPERAIEALASLVPKADARLELLKQVRAIAGADESSIAAEGDRLARLSQVLAAPIRKSGSADLRSVRGGRANREAERG